MTLPDGWRFTWSFLVILTLGIGCSYWNSFTIGFYFDDSYGIAENPAIRSLRNIPSYFVDPFTLTTVRENVDVRPILSASFALNYLISGVEPWSYHLFNLVLHWTAAVLVFVIVRDYLWWSPAALGSIKDGRIVAAAAALFFALAPLNSHSLNYMWARSALLCTTFYLAAFLAYLQRRWCLLGLFYSVALLTKAIAVTLPAVMLLYDFLYRDRTRYATIKEYFLEWRRFAMPLLLAAILDLAYLAYRWVLLPSWSEQTRREAFVTPWIWWISQWSAQLYYVRLFLWPDRLSVDHDFPYTINVFTARPLLAFLALTVWVAIALQARKRYPYVAFATAWFFITLAPESSFSPLPEVINEHRPYIASSLGLAVLLAGLLYHGARLFAGRTRVIFVSTCLALYISAVPVTLRRNQEWQDSLSLWESTVRASPGNARAWMNAGREHMARGRLDEARYYLERAREINPGYAYVYINLSVLEAEEGRLDNALRAAEQAVRLRPDLSPAHLYLGRVLKKLGKFDEAVAAFRRAIVIDPRNSEAREELSELGRAEAD
jgi:tetratricopeptide (TPR) repeat protein